jgi:ElaB/YqjD/DUF883 family membrane-anchored ribosome-binding protein
MVRLLAATFADRADNGGSAMSEDGTMATGASNEARNAEPKLSGASGEPVRSGSQLTQNQTDQLADFVKQQPFTAALVALVIGYLLGKIS